MTELTNVLYQFLSDYYLSGTIQNPEYQKAVSYAEARKKLLTSQLDEQQRRLLNTMLDEFNLAHTMERERIFLATLSLSRELSGLVRL